MLDLYKTEEGMEYLEGLGRKLKARKELLKEYWDVKKELDVSMVTVNRLKFAKSEIVKKIERIDADISILFNLE